MVETDPVGATIAAESSDVAVATVQIIGGNGVTVTAVGVGTATIAVAAAKDGYTTGTTSFTVTVPEVTQVPTTVTVTAADAAMDLNGDTTEQLAVVVKDADGADIANPEVTYAVTTGTAVTVDATGLVTATAVGSATITATCGSATGTVDITVVDSTPLAVSTVSNITATTIRVALADAPAADLTATDISKFAVLVNDVAVTPTAIAKYTTDTTGKTYTLTIPTLTNTEGNLTVNGTAPATKVAEGSDFDFDFKAPTIVSVTAVDSTHINVVFSEKMKKSSVEQAQTATGANQDVTGVYSVIKMTVPTTDIMTASTKPTLAADGKTLNITVGTMVSSPNGYMLQVRNDSDEGGSYVAGTDTPAQDLAGNIVLTGSEFTFSGVGTSDSTGPAATASTYDPANNQLTVAFNEAVTLTGLSKTGFSISDGTTTVALTNSESAALSNNTSVVFTLTSTTATSVEALGASRQLAIAAAAIKDTSNNGIAAQTLSIGDVPALVSATYDQLTNKAVLTFNKTIDVSTLNLAKITFVNTGGTNLTLTAGTYPTGSARVTTTDGTSVEINVENSSGSNNIESSAVTARTLTIAASFGTDMAGTAIATSTGTTVTYTADTTVPTLVSAAYNASTDVITFTLSEKVKWNQVVPANIKIYDITNSSTGTLICSLTGESVQETSNGTSISFDLTAGTNDASIEAVTTKSNLRVVLTASAFADEASNAIAALPIASAVTLSYVDQTPPTLSSATPAQLSMSLFTVAFDKEVDRTSATTASNYTFYKSDNPAVTIAVSSVALASDNLTAYLTLSSNATLAYQYKVKAINVMDTFGNVIVNDGTANVTNAVTVASTSDSTAPYVSTVTYRDVNSNVTVDAGDTLNIAFTEPVTIVSALSGSDFTTGSWTTDNSYGTGATFAAGSSPNEILITFGTTPGLAVANFGSGTINSKVTTKITDLAGNASIARAAGAITITAPDTTAPYLSSAVYSDYNANGQIDPGDKLTLTFSEALDSTVDLTADATKAGIETGASWFDYAAVANGTDNIGAGATLATAAYATNDTQIVVTLGTGADLDGVTGTQNTYLTRGTSAIDVRPANLALKDKWQNAIIANATTSPVVITSADSTRPTITGATFYDNNTSGITVGDYVILTVSEPVTVTTGTFAPETDLWFSGGGVIKDADVTVTQPTSTTIKLAFTAFSSSAFTAGVTQVSFAAAGSLTVHDASGNTGSPGTAVTMAAGATDTTAPTLVSVILGQESTASGSLASNTVAGRALNYVQFNFSEAVIVDDNGSTGGFANALTADGTTKTASTAAIGSMASTTALLDFGVFGTAAAAAVNAGATDNTMIQSADGRTITVYINASAFNPVAMTTGPSGTFTATGNKIYDAAGNQLSTSASVTASAAGSGWDLTRPVLTAAGIDTGVAATWGTVGDMISFTFNEGVAALGTVGTDYTATMTATAAQTDKIVVQNLYTLGNAAAGDGFTAENSGETAEATAKAVSGTTNNILTITYAAQSTGTTSGIASTDINVDDTDGLEAANAVVTDLAGNALALPAADIVTTLTTH